MKLLGVLSLIGLLSQSALAEDALFVQSVTLSLKAEPAISATDVGKLARGDKVTKVDAKPPWVKVKSPKGTGWIPAIMASSHEPPAKESMLSGSEDFAKNSRKRASANASAGAARGLKDDSADLLVRLHGSDYDALEKLYKNFVSPEAAYGFLKL